MLTLAAAFETEYMMVPCSPTCGTLLPAVELMVSTRAGSSLEAACCSKGRNLRTLISTVCDFAGENSLLLRELKDASHIEIQDLDGTARRRILEPRTLGRAGIAHQNVQAFAPNNALDLAHKALNVLGVGHVRRKTNGLSADSGQLVQLLDCLRDALLPFELAGGDDDVGAASEKEGGGHVQAKAAGAAGDDSRSALERKCAAEVLEIGHDDFCEVSQWRGDRIARRRVLGVEWLSRHDQAQHLA
ncbi:hypothetical protein BN1708_002950 [Verticillium longisporum]|uniref:Uncharacterized protein n=1 Tax=Verticillium longisporum TaxID=100787 RepID=A0A0G4L432_VERLO|nr:hypothetical protein BN1708_002950 [Verticillium longisporum]